MPKGSGTGDAGFDQVVQGTQDWNNRFIDNYGGATGWAQGNPWATGYTDYYNNTLSGSMANNPWMSRLYDQTGNLDMNEGLNYLRGYIGGNTGGRGGGNSGLVAASSRGGGRPGSANIPDSTVGQGFFSQHINELFDPAVLDPANNPTIQPMVDAFSNEALQDYWRSVADLTNMAEGAGRYGGGSYQAMRGQAQDQFNEATQQTLAGIYMKDREDALQRQMDALGLVNTRDISQGQINAQLEAARMQQAQASAASAAQLQAAREANRLNAIGMMLDAGQFGMTMGGNMAQLMSQNQANAGQLGLGFAQLGLEGYNTAANYGQLGLGAMNQLGNIYGNAASNRLAQQQMAEEQRRYEQQQPIRDITSLIDIMQGLNTMGGYDYLNPYIPSSSGPTPQGFNWGDALGSIIGGMNSFYGTQP